MCPSYVFVGSWNFLVFHFNHPTLQTFQMIVKQSNNQVCLGLGLNTFLSSSWKFSWLLVSCHSQQHPLHLPHHQMVWEFLYLYRKHLFTIRSYCKSDSVHYFDGYNSARTTIHQIVYLKSQLNWTSEDKRYLPKKYNLYFRTAGCYACQDIGININISIKFRPRKC